MVAYVFDLGLKPSRLVVKGFRRRMRWLGWVLVRGDDCSWSYRFGTFTVTFDLTGLGFVETEYELDGVRREYLMRRLCGIVGKTASWRLTGERMLRLSEKPVESDAKGVALADLLAGECEAIAHRVLLRRVSFIHTGDVVVQKARLERFKDSPLLHMPDGEWVRLSETLDHANRLIDGFYGRSDREARFLSDLLIFIVSVATVIPLFYMDWGNRILPNWSVWLTVSALIGVFIHGIRRG